MAFLLFSNLFIAGGAAALTYATGCLWWPSTAEASPDIWVAAAFVFVATLIVYNLDRLVGGAEREDEVDATVRHGWIDDARRSLWGVVVICTLIGGALIWWIPVRAWVVLAPLGVFAIGYAVPVHVPGLGRWRLKEVPGLKIVLIVVVWAGATVLFPAACLGELSAARAWWLAGFRGLFIFALTLPFDLRDIERDRRAGIQTIPHLIGRRGTVRLSMVSMVTFGVGSVVYFARAAQGGWPPVATAHAVTAGVSLMVLWPASTQRGERYFVGVVDGMIWVYAVALLLTV